MLTVSALLLFAAFVLAVASAMGRAPLWAAVILLCVLLALSLFPVR